MMECTYGDKPHHDPDEAYLEFHQSFLRTVKRGGKVIIPAFAVGRTQELVYNLNRMVAAGELPQASPSTWTARWPSTQRRSSTEHPECYDEETQRVHPHRAAPGPGIRRPEVYPRSVEESKALNERKEPMVIISASGMAEAGASCIT